jgi:hypothetical protein
MIACEEGLYNIYLEPILVFDHKLNDDTQELWKSIK